MLQDIEAYAEDEYTLKDALIELNIAMKLIKDEQVIQAYERGLTKLFISMYSSGMSEKDITDSFDINAEQCALWGKKHRDEIEQKQQKIKNEERHATKQFSNTLYSGMVNIMTQNISSDTPISEEILRDDIETMVKKMQAGDMSDIITVLTTNIMQLQLFNGTVTNNLMGAAGKQLPNFNMLSNMQIKLMQETRKSIMAINEITNPKRTTFIKEANQHNHLHQNSEKKVENENEKQNTLNQPDPVIDAELYKEKEKCHDNK